MSLTIHIESIHTDEAHDLIQQLTQELAPRYPADLQQGNASFKPEDMDVAGACFVVARWSGVAVGCGAIRPFDEDAQNSAEVKRMFVLPQHRGKGISKAILRKLEDAAHDFGYAKLILETGTRQLEAMALYERMGYTRCACWGKYLHNDWSVCFDKVIERPSRR